MFDLHLAILYGNCNQRDFALATMLKSSDYISRDTQHRIVWQVGPATVAIDFLVAGQKVAGQRFNLVLVDTDTPRGAAPKDLVSMLDRLHEVMRPAIKSIPPDSQHPAKDPRP